MKFKSIYFILSTCILMSCEDFFDTTIDIDPPKHEEKLVIIGNAEAGDSVVNFTMSKTVEILGVDSTLKFIAGVKIDAKFNNNPIAVSQKVLDDIPYYQIVLPQHLKSYDKINIKATYQDLPVLEVESITPQAPEITNIKFEYDGGKNQQGDLVSKLSFDYKNTQDVVYLSTLSNLFYIRCLEFDDNFNCIRSDTFNYKSSLSNSDPRAINSTYFKKEKSVDGDMIRYNGTIYRYSLNEKDVRFEVITMTEPIGNYEISKINYYNSRDNPFATPVNVQSNVKNGFGALALNNVIRIKI